MNGRCHKKTQQWLLPGCQIQSKPAGQSASLISAAQSQSQATCDQLPVPAFAGLSVSTEKINLLTISQLNRELTSDPGSSTASLEQEEQ